MGAYLSEPNTQKESQDDSTDQISYGASSMQGWRLEQEDAHTSLLNFDARTRSSLFAVYDGHGGSEVAKYCAKYLPEYLQSHLDEFRDGGDLKAALKHLFLALDERLKSEEAQRELKEMRDKSEKGDDADTTAIQNDEDLSQNGSDEEGAGNGEEKKSETELLYDEATMPLEQVLMRYRKCETRVKKVLEKNKPKNSSEEEKENHKHEEKKSGEVVDFQKQEEIDINEIKKNSKSDSSESNNNSNHEQDYDEASNLGDITESQQKNNKSTNDNSKSNSESKQKLNKEELKLSPITKKSSFSSNDEDTESNNKPTSTSRDNSNESSNEESTHNQEKEHKTPRASSSSSGIDVEVETSEEASVSVKKSSASSNSRNNALLAKKLQLPLRNVSHKSQNLIAKFIADCVNTKLKAANKLISNKPAAAVAAASSRRNKKKNKKAESDEKEEGKNGVKEGDEEEADEEFEEASGGDSEEEEEEEDEEDEDDDEDSSEDEDEEFEDDDDDDDEEEDDEDDEDEEEEDDEEEDDEEDEDYEIEKVEYDMEMQGEGVLAGQPRPGYDSGCTAVVALLVDQKHLYVANAGDSRCVVCRDGKAVDMSEDHKPEDEIERTRIERAGGTISKDGRVNNGLNLSRAIGDHSYKLNEGLPLSEQMITSMPDVKYLELDSQRDKFMVLACDGIWNFMSSQEVCDYVSERLNANYSKLSQICEELFMHCLAPNSEGDGTGCDNMTCIIVTFNPFRQASAQIPPAQAVAAGLKRSHENNNNNGKENGGGDAASNKPHDPVDVVKSESGKEAASQNNNEDEASNISKKLKQEHDGRDLGHVISERAS